MCDEMYILDPIDGSDQRLVLSLSTQQLVPAPANISVTT